MISKIEKILLIKTNDWVLLEPWGNEMIEISPEELRQIKISIKTRIEWATKDTEDSSEFQSNIDFMEALLKKLESISSQRL